MIMVFTGNTITFGKVVYYFPQSQLYRVMFILLVPVTPYTLRKMKTRSKKILYMTEGLSISFTLKLSILVNWYCRIPQTWPQPFINRAKRASGDNTGC